ncbi:MAG: Nif3-like dinuclear metal center hexameric protein [Gemmatimonadota bacterium]|nr:Nif3-like dinuclear metal center hexameric protein [Gemmatimonadota bacterium]
MSVSLDIVVAHLDDYLRIREIGDYPNAINGLQISHRGPVHSIATAVDASARTIKGAVAAGANLLIVHHGLYWSGLQPIVGHRYERLRLLVDHDLAVYAAHLPLDAHAEIGNSCLLAHELGLAPTAGFAHHEGVPLGVCGDCDLPTHEIIASADRFARTHGGATIASESTSGRRTRRWAICSGAGAGTSTIAEAVRLGVDTLIVGEGPHWTAVDAPEHGLVVVYAGHYATETLGVRALGDRLSATFGLSHHFVPAPTGL